jgi:hypothetical protein
LNGRSYTSIPINITAEELSVRLQSSRDFGFMNIQRSGDCTGYSYTLEWLVNGGAKSLLTVTNTNALTPAGTTITISRVQGGGVLFKPLSGDLTRLHETLPQVSEHSALKITGLCASLLLRISMHHLGQCSRWWLPFAMHGSRRLYFSMVDKSNTDPHIHHTEWNDTQHRWHRFQYNNR